MNCYTFSPEELARYEEDIIKKALAEKDREIDCLSEQVHVLNKECCAYEKERESTWTTQQPSKPGWYWARTNMNYRAVIAYVDEHRQVLFPGHDYMVDFSEVTDGQWSSEPIKEPEEP